ncbi:hypothetical protein NIES2100_05690 [Calothrix sp. NIES-2100]|uniref:Npun_F0296 family exosortase-dependent surface protein n=1 Tax=Calothrix sp. NIES-2100 TaxID=1954172 RepID=UPI000B5F611A|nr:hypothetical protein NIES2100_05690 [Calothrix sp. NIES-2100]
MKSLLIKSAIASGVVLSLAAVTRPAMAASFVVSIEDAKVVNANLGNLTQAKVQTFDSQGTTNYSATGFEWKDGTTKIGTYTNTQIRTADQYGGAGANSQYNNKNQYFDVDASRSGNGQTVSTLKLEQAQSYFGLWWSAGDATNVLKFLSKGQVVQTITTADVKNYISKLGTNSSTTTNPYYGNPTSAFQGQDSGEPFAFINFYDVDGTFDQVEFTNAVNSNGTSSGFESDNHTVATGYTKYSGTIVTVVPESSSLLGVLAIGLVGASSFLTRRVKKSSVA